MRIAINIQRFVLCFVFPVLVSILAYYGFSQTFSSKLFVLADFHAQYDHGIYRYRVLGKFLLLGIYHLLEHHRHGQMSSTTQLGTNFFLSYFILNTIFLCLTTWVLRATLDLQAFGSSEVEKKLWVMAVALLVAVTQYVVVPYDTMSYFFIVTAAFLMMRLSTPMSNAGLALVMVLATLTRETPALIVALYAALYLMRRSLRFQPTLAGLATVLAAFVATYIGLRFALGWDRHALGQGLTHHVPLKGIAGVLFLVSGVLVTMDFSNTAKVKAALLFLAFSTPYIVVSLLTGVLFEVRLWVPLFICLILIHTLRFEAKLATVPVAVEPASNTVD